MKKIIFLCALMVLIGFGSANAAQIKFDLDPMGDLMVGDALQMNIFSEGWNDANGLVGGTVLVGYDPGILKFTSASITAEDFTIPRLYWDTRSASDNGTGQVRLVFSNIAFPLVTTDFLVGMVVFEAIGLGRSGLILTTENFANAAGALPDGTFIGSQGGVNVVPIPSTIVLLGGGLLGLVALRRRRS